MKIAIYDVGNAACSIISSPTNYGMMIDCGSTANNANPVDEYVNNKEWFGIKPFKTSKGVVYKLSLLHITHPDDDHVRNAKRIHDDLTPYLLRKRKCEEFTDADTINQEYKELIDDKYRGTDSEIVNWGFDINEIFQIPMFSLKNDDLLSKSIRNNSSILRFIEYKGISILYPGDLEKEGWDWLVKNNADFVTTVSKGINILIAPHHGHKSGFPTSLFEIIEKVDVVIHSKGSEGDSDWTDVSTQYTAKANGIIYKNLNDGFSYKAKTLTTRSNGHIYIQITDNAFTVWASKASSNHEKLV
jgi:beta-lactamase superfamily II metal-dependent hydrolase